MNNILKICALLSLVVNTAFASDTIGKVAVIVPIEHRAMNNIVKGVKDNLKENVGMDKVVVFNGMGDTNNINSIISQVAQNSDYKAIMPIGTNATYIALGATKSKHIIGLGSMINEETRQELIAQDHKNLTNVYDELTGEEILQFVTSLKKRNILLVFSNDEKIISQLREIDVAKDKYEIKINKFNVSNTTDIYGITAAISNIDCILILKDHMVVSMINVIASNAEDKNIPIVALDQGSAANGADVAVGVDEYEIGVAGAKIFQEITQGKEPFDIPVQKISNIKIFVNPKSKISVHELQVVSNNLGYKIEHLTN